MAQFNGGSCVFDVEVCRRSTSATCACSGEFPRQRRAVLVLVILVSCYLLKPRTLCHHTFNVFIYVSPPRLTWWDSIK